MEFLFLFERYDRNGERSKQAKRVTRSASQEPPVALGIVLCLPVLGLVVPNNGARESKKNGGSSSGFAVSLRNSLASDAMNFLPSATPLSS